MAVCRETISSGSDARVSQRASVSSPAAVRAVDNNSNSDPRPKISRSSAYTWAESSNRSPGAPVPTHLPSTGLARHGRDRPLREFLAAGNSLVQHDEGDEHRQGDQQPPPANTFEPNAAHAISAAASTTPRRTLPIRTKACCLRADSARQRAMRFRYSESGWRGSTVSALSIANVLEGLRFRVRRETEAEVTAKKTPQSEECGLELD